MILLESVNDCACVSGGRAEQRMIVLESVVVKQISAENDCG